ncbi:MAG TPA: GGDEF domain-containing protein [Candidatus Hydrogenedentes bacterium]|nr:GGDEF domain-containing protein [Candidatus Hydrogenedentota bacterium]HOV74363.1 GGDEF domain-containing protein [Candidatus Hydrogenedentota bacterium]
MILDDALFQKLLENLSEGVYFVDPQRTILYWNRAAERITGFSEKEIEGKSCADDILVHVDDAGTSLCKGACPLAATMKDGQNRVNRVYLRHKEGYRLPVCVSTAAIRDDTGNVIGGLETFHDDSSLVAALAEAERLSQLALICPLTGIGNRRFAEETIAKRLSESQRNHTACAFVMFDVDHFKKINDSYGHPVGDIVLKMVAQTLLTNLRVYDFVGRWGGEEFLLTMPHLSRQELENTANRLRVLVERSSRKISENRLAVTISGGATLSRADDTPASVIKRVDALLYESKRRGRNRVTIG